MRVTVGILSVLLVMVLALFFGSARPQRVSAQDQATAAATMTDMTSEYSTNDLAPLAKGLYEGKDVYFIHTEASDPQIAETLTKMMGPKVLVVPSLAKIDDALLGNVYVFANGVKGMGPFGFQPDVFDSVPEQDNYTPLRKVNLIKWWDNNDAEVLTSVEAIEKAEKDGRLNITHPGVVVNMPILVWPDGKR